MYKKGFYIKLPTIVDVPKTKQIQKDTTVWSTESSTDGSDPLIKEVPWIRH